MSILCIKIKSFLFIILLHIHYFVLKFTLFLHLHVKNILIILSKHFILILYYSFYLQYMHMNVSKNL